LLELAPEQRLALAFGPNDLRAPQSSLLLFDAFLAKTVRLAREPLLGQIRLGWWREQIELLPAPNPGPDPMLVNLDELVRCRQVATADLHALVNAWETMLDERRHSGSDLIAIALARGGAVFRLASAIAGTAFDNRTDQAGTLWALVDYARHSNDSGLARHALDLATGFCGVAHALPRQMRPYAILARFAELDAIRGLDGMTPSGTPRRILQAWALALGLS
jgi:phytoene synthase